MREPYPTIDPQGDMAVHNQQGVQVVLSFTEPGTSTPRSMTGKTVYFEASTSPVTRVQLTAGDVASDMKLTIPQGVFAAYINSPLRFVIVDESTSLHELLWEGRLSVRGW